MSFNLNKYFIMGTENCVGKHPLYILEEALKGGITMFQLREKGKNALSGETYIRFAKECQELCQRYNVPFIINDDVELALAIDADGIHVGQDDLQLSLFRHRCPKKIVGVSVHTMEELEKAVQDGADYVGIGSIFDTKSKVDAQQSSLSFLAEARNAYPNIPIVAIGGITTENSHLVRNLGVNGVAVINAITKSDNIQETVINI